jgi:hypothetical protein
MLYIISLDMHKELFIWLHVVSLGQPWINSWGHHDLDIETSLEFFSSKQNLKIIFISWNRWSLCQCSKYILIFMESNLESNSWYSSIIYERFLHIKINEDISPFGLSLITKKHTWGHMHFHLLEALFCEIWLSQGWKPKIFDHAMKTLVHCSLLEDISFGEPLL